MLSGGYKSKRVISVVGSVKQNMVTLIRIISVFVVKVLVIKSVVLYVKRSRMFR